MTEIHGIAGAPYSTPHVRRKLPAPFMRPSIDLDGGVHRKRSWKDTSVLDIKAGDVVADLGKILTVNEFIRMPGLNATPEQATQTVWRVRLHNVMGDYWDFPGHQRLFAFTPDTTDE